MNPTYTLEVTADGEVRIMKTWPDFSPFCAMTTLSLDSALRWIAQDSQQAVVISVQLVSP